MFEMFCDKCVFMYIEFSYQTNIISLNYLLSGGTKTRSYSHCDSQCAEIGSVPPDRFWTRDWRLVWGFGNAMVALACPKQ